MDKRHEMIVDLSNHFREEHMIATFCAYPPEVIARVHAFFHDEQGWTSPHRISTQQGNIILMVQMGFGAEHITDALTYLPSLVEHCKGKTIKAIVALDDYRKNGWVPAVPDLEPDPLALNVMLTTLDIIAAMEERYKDNQPGGQYPAGTPIREFSHLSDGGIMDNYQTLDDEMLVRAIWEHPGRSEQIIEIVRERGVLDTNLIFSMLDAPSASLSAGML